MDGNSVLKQSVKIDRNHLEGIEEETFNLNVEDLNSQSSQYYFYANVSCAYELVLYTSQCIALGFFLNKTKQCLEKIAHFERYNRNTYLVT